MINVFISHNNKDKAIARIIAKKLNQYGIYAWVDELEIKIGDSLIEKIREGIDKVDYLIALISENSVNSEWVKRELDSAMNREIENKKIIVLPIIVGKCDLPGFLKGKLYIDMTTTRKINKNFPQLLSRFEVTYIDGNIKERFSEFNLTVAEIIEKLEKEDDYERIKILDSISYKDNDLFKMDTFIRCINNLISKERNKVDLILSILTACSNCPSNLFVKFNFMDLMGCSDEVQTQVIEISKNKRTLNLFDKRIFYLLVSNVNKQLEKVILNYFLQKGANSQLSEKIYEYCVDSLQQGSCENENILLKILFRNYLEDYSDKVIEIALKKYESFVEGKREELIIDFCNFGSQFEWININNPKLRDKFKEILLQSISDDEEINSAIGLFLLVGNSNFIKEREEVWDIVLQLDDYSLEMLMNRLRGEYDLGYVFPSEIDVSGLIKLINRNPNFKDSAGEALTEIKLKSALDAIVTYSIEPGYYNISNILLTIIEKTNVKDYESLLEKLRVKIETSGINSGLDNLILEIAFYKINKSINKVINSFDFDFKQFHKSIYNNPKLELVFKELKIIQNEVNEENRIKIQSFINSAKSLIVERNLWS